MYQSPGKISSLALQVATERCKCNASISGSDVAANLVSTAGSASIVPPRRYDGEFSHRKQRWQACDLSRSVRTTESRPGFGRDAISTAVCRSLWWVSPGHVFLAAQHRVRFHRRRACESAPQVFSGFARVLNVSALDQDVVLDPFAFGLSFEHILTALKVQ